MSPRNLLASLFICGHHPASISRPLIARTDRETGDAEVVHGRRYRGVLGVEHGFV